jgi:hypothetical protein
MLQRLFILANEIYDKTFLVFALCVLAGFWCGGNDGQPPTVVTEPSGKRKSSTGSKR